MKTLRSLLILPVLLVPAGAALGQINHPHNELGLYVVPDPDGCATAQIDAPAGSRFTAYLVLTSPWNEERDAPVATIGGLECRLVLPDDVQVLSTLFPPFTEVWPSQEGNAIEYLVATRVPVVDGRALICSYSFAVGSDATGLFYLGPVVRAPASIPDHMAFTDFDDDFALEPMYPVSGSADVPVFALNWDGDLSFCETVPVEATSFGSLKALYR